MKELYELREMLANKRPDKWDDLPDIGLYMDQVLTYMSRQLIGDESLTAAMINNYTKMGLLPRAEKKKYNPDHLAMLTQLCMFKQALPVSDAGAIIAHSVGEGESMQAAYERFLKILDEVLVNAADIIDPEMGVDELREVVGELAISAYCLRLVCVKCIEVLTMKTQPEAGNEPEKEKKAKKSKEDPAQVK